MELDLHIAIPPANIDDATLDTDRDSILDTLAEEREEVKTKLLYMLEQLVKDSKSSIYSGFITSRLDPSFTQNLVDRPEEAEDDDDAPYSNDPEVLRLMQKYYDVEIPNSFFDISHFNIGVCYSEDDDGSGRRYEGTISVPNPVVIRKRCCGLWPFEVMQALGFMNTMQELWLKPIGLTPINMPATLTQRVPFEPSVRMGGEMFIHASQLKADLVYEVSILFA